MNATTFATQALTIVAITITSAHAGFDWDARAKNAIAAAKPSASTGNDALALVRTAMSEASGSRNGNGNDANRSPDVDLRAASESVAAYVVLECFFPEQQPGLEMDLALALAGFPESQRKADALVSGRRAATEVLRSRNQRCGTDFPPR